MNRICNGCVVLELNGYRFVASEEDSTQAVFSLAKGLLDEAGFRLFIEDNSIAS